MVISTERKRASRSTKSSTAAKHWGVKAAVYKPRRTAQKTTRKRRTKVDDRVWDIERILQRSENGQRLLVKWKGIDPKTGRPWKNDWIDKSQLAHEFNWEIEEILEEREGGTKFVVRWKGVNPETDRPWPDSEIDVECLAPKTLQDWKIEKARKHACSHAKVKPPFCKKEEFNNAKDVKMTESISQVVFKSSTRFSKLSSISSILRQPGVHIRKPHRVRFRSASLA